MRQLARTPPKWLTSSSRSQHACRTRHPTAAGCMLLISSLWWLLIWWLLQSAYGTEGFITAFSLMNIILCSYSSSIPHLFFPFPPLHLPLPWISFSLPPTVPQPCISHVRDSVISVSLHLPCERHCDICLPDAGFFHSPWWFYPFSCKWLIFVLFYDRIKLHCPCIQTAVSLSIHLLNACKLSLYLDYWELFCHERENTNLSYRPLDSQGDLPRGGITGPCGSWVARCL